MQVSTNYLKAESISYGFENKAYLKDEAKKEPYSVDAESIILSIAEENLKSTNTAPSNLQDAVSLINNTVTDILKNPSAALLSQGNLSQDAVTGNL